MILLPLLTLAPVTETVAQGARLLSMNWYGPNLVLKFSDSVSFHTDVVESDSGLVLNFDEPVEIGETSEAIHDGIVARFNRKGTKFRLEGESRVGYSMLWGPYSNSLVVYTFDWDSLSFAERQFHLGLVALEQGIPDVSTEYLTTARNADTGVVAKRAAGVLGLVYEQTGEDSLASLYLGDPRDQDMWGARASVLRRSGDTAAAAAAERQMAAAGDQLPGLASADDAPDELAETSTTDPGDFLTGWQGTALLVVAGILILVIATMFARRPPKKPETTVEPHRHASDTGAAPPVPPVRREPTQEDIEHSTPPPSPEEAEEIVTKEIPEKKSSIADVYSPPSATPERESEALKGLDDETPEETNPVPPPAPARQESTRSSRQADALRQRVSGESAAEEDASTASAQASASEETEEDSVISKARKMNVSRDHVALRERLRKMREG